MTSELQRALLDVLVRAMNGIARLKPDDRAPAALLKHGTRVDRIVGVGCELRRSPRQQRDPASQQHVALRHEGGDTGMRVISRSVHGVRFLFLVIAKSLFELQHAHKGQPIPVEQRNLVALVPLARLLPRHRQSDRQGPRSAVRETHVPQDALVIRSSHETLEGTVSSDAEQLQVRGGARGEPHAGSASHALGQRRAVGLRSHPIDQYRILHVPKTSARGARARRSRRDVETGRPRRHVGRNGRK